MGTDGNRTRDFNAEAALWDDNPGRVQNARAIADAIVRQVPLNSGMDVLDYGAGTGIVTLALSPLTRRIVAVDSATAMLSRLEEKAGNGGLTNVSSLVLDLERDPVPEQRFDLIVSTMTLHHIEDVQYVLRRLCEMLNPGGHLALADLDQEGGRFHADSTGVKHNGFERAEVRRYLTENGLENVSISTANTINKGEDSEGPLVFTVFLAAGRKPGVYARQG